MTRGLSAYLDLIRLLAALGVVLSHARFYLLPGLPWALTSHGGECVAVFFVLSGFVIRFASLEKDESHWKTYAIARLARIVPVAVLSFVITLIFTLLSVHYGPTFLHQFGTMTPLGEVFDLVRSAVFLNEVWFTHSVFGTNEPYWSLGFEVPYYLLFGLVMFLRGRLRWIAVVGWYGVYGLKIVAFLPLWLLGAGLYTIVRKQQDGPPRVLLGPALILAAGIAFYCIHKALLPEKASIFRPESYRETILAASYYLLVGLTFAASVIGANLALRGSDSRAARLGRPVQWLAGGSFTIYLCHLPMMVAAYAMSAGTPARPLVGWSLLLLILVACFGLAELAERRKHLVRQQIGRLFGVQSQRRLNVGLAKVP